MVTSREDRDKTLGMHLVTVQQALCLLCHRTVVYSVIELGRELVVLLYPALFVDPIDVVEVGRSWRLGLGVMGRLGGG